MSDIRVSSLEEIGDVFVSAFGDYKVDIIVNLFDNLMETTPEKTGTLKYNWRLSKDGSPGNFRQPNTGENWPDPPRPNELMRVKSKPVISLYNNSEYIIKVNNGESGNEQNQNFIQEALAMTSVIF